MASKCPVSGCNADTDKVLCDHHWDVLPGAMKRQVVAASRAVDDAIAAAVPLNRAVAEARARYDHALTAAMARADLAS